MQALIQLDRTMGSGALLAASEAEYQLIDDLIGRTARTDDMAGEMRVLAATAGGIAGWIAYDNDDPHSSRRHYASAICFAAAARAQDLSVYLALHLANLCCDTGKPAEALSLLKAVEDTVDCDELSSRTLASMHAAGAHAYARLGDATGYARCRDDALIALQCDNGRPGTPLNSWLTPTILDVDLGVGLIHLRQYRRAIHHFTSLHTGAYCTTKDRRSAAIHFTQAAMAHVYDGTLDEAVHYATRARELLCSIRSPRASRKFSQLSSAFSAHSAHPAVRAFRREGSAVVWRPYGRGTDKE
ncbi:hypothetical protein RB200_05165 [Streptomyces sp. PmtG]